MELERVKLRFDYVITHEERDIVCRVIYPALRPIPPNPGGRG
ncbi:MAG: hypothetical protein R2941_04665 [Desulfobacterales bacterium]